MNPAPAPHTTATLRLPWLNRAALRYWSFHVCISATPSFLFALSFGGGPSQIVGMALGVMVVIFLYTRFACWTYGPPDTASLWLRAVRVATWLRAGSLLLTVLMGVSGQRDVLFGVAPDLWAGMASYWTIGWLMDTPVVKLVQELVGAPGSFWIGNAEAVVPTFCIVLVEGLLLSAMLGLLAFICLGILTFIARRKAALVVTNQP